ncbi:MAG: DUF3237 family protein [Actinomycetota bacterium]
MPTLDEFCTIQATLAPRMLGNMPQGTRIDFGFEGVATSPHWQGERPVAGVDYSLVRSDGNMDLDIRGTIGTKRETVAYRASGVSIVKSPTEAHPQELLTFTTGNADLAWLNTAVGVALGKGESGTINITIYIVKD